MLKPHTARQVKKLISAKNVTFSDMAAAIDSFMCLAPNLAGIREIFGCGMRDLGNFACGIRNPGLWNTEYC